MKKEKIAIITWCNNESKTNYGQVLQAYALQRYLRNSGYSVKVINYRKVRDDEIRRPGYLLSNTFLYEEYHRAKKIEKKYDKRIFRFFCFVKSQVAITKPCHTKEELESQVEDCGVMICGSDQIWNPYWFQRVYALDFGTKQQRRIAYAPGGIALENDFCAEKYRELAVYLKDFYRISVREEESAEILQKYTDKKVVDVLDPTFLLKKSEWDKVASKRLIKAPYVFCYNLGSLRPHKHVLSAILKRYGAEKAVYIPSNLDDVSEGFESYDFIRYKSAGPAEFLSLIKYARAVCTDSFHGMALSVKYEKQFFIMERIQENNAVIASEMRQNNILKKCGIGSRKVKCIKDVRELADIDYEQVNLCLEKEINRSEEFLKEAVGEE